MWRGRSVARGAWLADERRVEIRRIGARLSSDQSALFAFLEGGIINVKRFGTWILMAITALPISQGWGESPVPFIPDDFAVPTELTADRYRLRMLTIRDVVQDYDAVMSSAEHIAHVNPFPGSDWPAGLTLEDNLIDLGWHQAEFRNRTSFAFTVVELDESRVIGCVYIFPTRKAGYDARVVLWTRPPEQLSFLDEQELRGVVRRWLSEAWPFKRPAFPGADLSWEAWAALPERAR